MSLGIFQIVVVGCLVVFLFGSRSLPKWGEKLGRLARSLRGPVEDPLAPVNTVKSLAKLTGRGPPWLK